MSIKGKAYVAGIYEHPTRKADGISLAQIHADVAKGALEDAGLSRDDVDGYFVAGDSPGLGPLNMADYLGPGRDFAMERRERLRALVPVDFGGGCGELGRRAMPFSPAASSSWRTGRGHWS